jgi:uncharacterized membrane protein YecN with MAPEG domain
VTSHRGQQVRVDPVADRDTGLVPFALLPLALLELNGGSPTLLHGLGVALLGARIAHPLGLKKDTIEPPLRAIGAGLTVLTLVVTAGALALKVL